MKIGVLTFHRAINYGAVLQAYSLVEKLKTEFPEDVVEIVDYNCKAREFYNLKCPIVFFLRRSPREAIQKIIQTRTFKKFAKRLPLSKSFCGSKESKVEKYISRTYDILIVGSDAVFNWGDLGLPNIYFADNITGVHKLTYAASAHLQKYEETTVEEKAFLNEALSKFEYVGVRDAGSERFVNFFCEKKCFHNCDPTVFLPMNFPKDSLKEKLKKHNFDFNKKSVFVMLMRRGISKMVRQKFGDDVQIVALMDANEEADVYLYDLNPFEWGHVFSYADFVVTDYFHATMLSLKNGTPVMSVDSSRYCEKNYESKAYDLLHTRLGMPELYININEFKDEQSANNVFNERVDRILNTFDKMKVQERLLQEAEHSSSFLEALKIIHSNKERG